MTIPAALLVIPVIVPEPVMLTVPVLVKLPAPVVVVPVPERSTVPALARVAIEQLPLKFNVAAAAFVSPPVPAKVPLGVIVPVLVNVTPTPVTVKVVPDVKAPLLV